MRLPAAAPEHGSKMSATVATTCWLRHRSQCVPDEQTTNDIGLCDRHLAWLQDPEQES